MLDTLLTEKQLAEIFSLSDVTLRIWRTKGKGPPHVKIGGAVRYREKDVEAWIASRVVEVPDGKRG